MNNDIKGQASSPSGPSTAGAQPLSWAKRAVSASAKAAVVAGALLVAHVSTLAPWAWDGGASPGFARAHVFAVSGLLTAAMALGLAGSAALAVRLLGLEARWGDRALWASAALAVLAPPALCWSAFGLFNARLDGAAIVGIAACMAAACAAALGFGVAVGELASRAARVWPASVAVLALMGAVMIAPRVSPELLAPAPLPTAAEAPPAAPIQRPLPAATLNPDTAPKVVIFLTIDTLRVDHLGFNGYKRATSPNLDALAAEGVVLERMMSTSSGTVPSFISLHTGLAPPCTHGTSQLATIAPSFNTLAERFKAAGYTTFAATTNPVLDESRGFFQGFDRHEALGDVPAHQVMDRAEALWEASGDGKVFAWIHFFDPHTPYEAPKEAAAPFLKDALYSAQTLPLVGYGSYGGVNAQRTLGAPLSGEAVEGDITAAYDAEITVADAGVGRLMKLIESKGVRDETVLFFTVDHGEVLYRTSEDIYYQHALDLYADTTHVPAIVWGPGRVPAGVRSDAMVNHTDVAPTLLHLAGLPVDPSALQGRALLGGGTPSRSASALQTAWWDGVSLKMLPVGVRNPTRAVVTDRWKLVDDPGTDLLHVTGPRSWLHAWRAVVSDLWLGDRLYDLQSDPGETRNVIAEHPEEAQRLRALLHSLNAGYTKAGCPSGGGSKAIEMDSTVEDQLKSLGYH